MCLKAPCALCSVAPVTTKRSASVPCCCRSRNPHELRPLVHPAADASLRLSGEAVASDSPVSFVMCCCYCTSGSIADLGTVVGSPTQLGRMYASTPLQRSQINCSANQANGTKSGRASTSTIASCPHVLHDARSQCASSHRTSPTVDGDVSDCLRFIAGPNRFSWDEITFSFNYPDRKLWMIRN
jgi:hypothetical protein